MHRLEITGETPEALYFNVVKTLSIFLRGTQAPASAPQVDDEPETAKVVSGSGQSEGRVVDAPSVAEVIPPKKRGRPGTKNTEPKVLNDEIPDLAASKTTEHEAKELTLDGDIRPRLQAIQAAGVARGWDMPKCVSYIQQLYGPFGIANARQLKPEQFAEFMEASEAYLTGEA